MQVSPLSKTERRKCTVAFWVMIAGVPIALLGVAWDAFHGAFAWGHLVFPALIFCSALVIRLDASR